VWRILWLLNAVQVYYKYLVGIKDW
jgi:hypothetical protein